MTSTYTGSQGAGSCDATRQRRAPAAYGGGGVVDLVSGRRWVGDADLDAGGADGRKNGDGEAVDAFDASQLRSMPKSIDRSNALP